MSQPILRVLPKPEPTINADLVQKLETLLAYANTGQLKEFITVYETTDGSSELWTHSFNSKFMALASVLTQDAALSGYGED